MSRPECFERPPASVDSYYRFDDFEAFSLPASALNRSWELHLPRELVSHDVSEHEWYVYSLPVVLSIPSLRGIYLSRRTLSFDSHKVDWPGRNS